MTETKPVSFRLSESALEDLEQLVVLDARRTHGYGRSGHEHAGVRSIRARRLLLEDAIYFLLQEYENTMEVPDEERRTGAKVTGLDD